MSFKFKVNDRVYQRSHGKDVKLGVVDSIGTSTQWGNLVGVRFDSDSCVQCGREHEFEHASPDAPPPPPPAETDEDRRARLANEILQVVDKLDGMASLWGHFTGEFQECRQKLREIAESVRSEGNLL